MELFLREIQAIVPLIRHGWLIASLFDLPSQRWLDLSMVYSGLVSRHDDPCVVIKPVIVRVGQMSLSC